MKLLLAEDNPADVRLVREMLKQAGPHELQLEQVDRMSDAVDLLQRVDFDELLLDLGLPDVQGMDTLARAQAVSGDIPIVVLTGRDDQDFAISAVAAGAQDYLVKGQFNAEMLVRTIRYALERKRADDRLRHLAAIIDSCDEAIISKTLSGTIVSWNGGAERIYGYAARDMIGHTVSRIIPPDRNEEMESLLRRVENGEVVRQFETTHLRKDRTEIAVSVSLAPIRNARGEIVAVSCVGSDITSRKRTERALAESYARLQRFSEMSVDRELQMVVLKKEINALAAELGRPPPHSLGFADAAVGIPSTEQSKGLKDRSDFH